MRRRLAYLAHAAAGDAPELARRLPQLAKRAAWAIGVWGPSR